MLSIAEFETFDTEQIQILTSALHLDPPSDCHEASNQFNLRHIQL